MKTLIQRLKEIWSVKELRERITFTLLLVAVYRLGSFITLPGIDTAMLARELEQRNDANLIDLINLLTGGAFSNASIFALGIMPYISASIIIQLLGVAVPYFQKLQKDESGRNRMNQITRALTVLITLGQAPGYLSTYIPRGVYPDTTSWWILAVTIIVAGTIFVMWLGEKITDRGIGNGTSLIIMIGIISSLPSGLLTEFRTKIEPDGGGLVLFLMEMIILLFVIIVSILLVQGVRKVPIHSARRMMGNRYSAGNRSYLPLKVNSSGVMPIIFAQAIMLIPITLTGFVTDEPNFIVRNFSDYTGFLYNFTFFLLVVLFTYFYTAIVINPQQMADLLKREGSFIPGVRPGKKTAEYIDAVISRVTLPGSIFLGIVAILPAFAILANVNPAFAQFYGGTSLLIMVGVVLDTLAQVDSQLKMRQYDGLMKSGRIQGRVPANYPSSI
jgi:preprotein translocase subunit SecY